MFTSKHTSAPDQGAIEMVAEDELSSTTPEPVASTPAGPAVSAAATNAADPVFLDLLWEHTYGNYTVKTVQDPSDPSNTILQIFKAGTLIYSNSSHEFYDPEKKDSATDTSDSNLPPLLTNITGSGIPNLVISEFSGGAHCCSIYHIFELGDEFREVATIDAADGGAAFVDLDNNGVLNIATEDWSYAYAFTSYAGLSVPDIILRLVDSQYVVAPDLMFTEPPAPADYAKLVQEVRDAYVPSEDETEVKSPGEWGSDATLWGTMLELTYKGHLDMAMQLFDDCWQDEWDDKDAAAEKFWKQVAMSPHGRAVVEAQGYELPEPEPDPESVSSPPEDGRASHIVDIGESLASIAQQHGVTVEALCTANNISTNARISVAQKLFIP